MSNGSVGTPGIQEGYIAVTGGQVWFRVVGVNRPGIPLLILHGGPGAPHDYLEPLAAFGNQHPVIFYDQLGCGRSERPADASLWTIGRFVAELSQVRRALGLVHLHLLGQSWGGMLAVDYLLEQGTTGVSGLVISGPCLSTRRFVSDQRAYLQEMPAEILRVILAKEAARDCQSPEYQEAMLAYYRRHVCRLDFWPDCLNRTFAGLGQQVYLTMWGPSEFTMTGTLKDYDRTGQVKEIAIPTLFTCGRYDEATPETTAYYQSRLPDSEMVVIEDASHEHHLEKPEQYLEIVRNFLDRAEAANP